MKVCDICEDEPAEFEVDGWEDGDNQIWKYEVGKKCHTKIKKFIQDLKNKRGKQ